jgi:hypothetical protein
MDGAASDFERYPPKRLNAAEMLGDVQELEVGTTRVVGWCGRRF